MLGEAALGEAALSEGAGDGIQPIVSVGLVADQNMLVIVVELELGVIDFEPESPGDPEEADPEEPPTRPDTPDPLETVIQRFSSHSFVTRSTDTPASTFIPGRLSGGVTIGRKVSGGPDGQFGSLIVATFGEIELINTDGSLDSLVDEFAIDGHPVTVKVGYTEIDSQGREIVQPFSEFEVAYVATAGAWTLEHDTLRLRMRDQGIKLQHNLQLAVYGGNGGQQGTEEMTGRTVPVALGRVRNVPAQQVDPVFLTYQVHNASVSAISAVYDAGISVPGESGSPGSPINYADYAALTAASVTSGTYATALSGGYFRLGTTPVGTVTADVDGDNRDGSWVASPATIMRRILLMYSDIGTDAIDHASFFALHDLNSNIIGLFLSAGDESTIEQVMERIALSVGATVGQDRSGLYRAVRIDHPAEAGDPIYFFDDRNILLIERQPLPYGVPFRSWTLEYRRNWTVQKGGDLATSVSQSRRRFLESEARLRKVETPNVARAHPTSASATRASLIDSQGNADAEAVRLATLYEYGRSFYRLTVKGFLFQISIGDVVNIVYPRWDLDIIGGKDFIVVAVTDNSDSVETELEVFG